MKQIQGGEISSLFAAFRGWFCARHMDGFCFMEEDRATCFAEMMHAGKGG